jgi:hypothetical protein
LSGNAFIPTQQNYEYGLAEYGVAQNSGGLLIKTLDVNAYGAGNVVQTGWPIFLKYRPQLPMSRSALEADQWKSSPTRKH